MSSRVASAFRSLHRMSLSALQPLNVWDDREVSATVYHASRPRLAVALVVLMPLVVL